MDIARVSAGLTATADAIRRQQVRFDERAEKTVADSLALADPDSAGDAGALTADVVGMQTDSIVNSILYGIFRAQAEQQREAADLVKPR